MNCRQLLILFLILSSSLGYSQKIFREGYLIKNNGDTLNGFIQFEINQKIPKKCFFKRFDVASVVMYTSETIKEFGYNNGNCFESKKIDGDNKFIECLIKGKISLYNYKNKYFISKEKNELIELSNGIIKEKKNDEIIEYNNLSELFQALTSDVSNLKIPNNLRAEHYSLVRIIIKYNRESTDKYIVYNRDFGNQIINEATIHSRDRLTNYGLLNGINFNSSTLSPLNKNYYKSDIGVDIKHANWEIGLFYNYQISKFSRNWFLQAELYFCKQNSHFFNTFDSKLQNQNDKVEMNAELSYIKMPLLLQYNFMLTKRTYFVNLGFSYNYTIQNTGNAILEVQGIDNQIFLYESTNTTKETKAFFRNSFIGFGIKYFMLNNKFISIESRYEFGDGVSQSFGFDYFYGTKFETTQNKPKFQIIIAVGL